MKRYHSKKAIKESFLKLVAEKPLDKITVRDIVEDCGFTRNTFYYYYDDIFDIVDELLEANVDKFLNMDFESGTDRLEMLNAAIDLLPDDPKLIKHFCVSSKTVDIKFYFNKATDRFLVNYIQASAGDVEISDCDKKLIFGFYKSAAAGLLYTWIEEGMKVPLKSEFKRMGVLLCDSLFNAVQAAKDNPSPVELETLPEAEAENEKVVSD
ncbi:MAG: TetR/AcrR family transcriptional regulator [Clostridiales bacterium]|nr:TetR/AcrR family transcriptional regulator [Clostridiales bacterium]MCD7828056.1 TetR/AcrR family transcriptional regulator [Clostridiales bacterium]